MSLAAGALVAHKYYPQLGSCTNDNGAGKERGKGGRTINFNLYSPQNSSVSNSLGQPLSSAVFLPDQAAERFEVSRQFHPENGNASCLPRLVSVGGQ